MRMEDAFQILLKNHEDTCPTDTRSQRCAHDPQCDTNSPEGEHKIAYSALTEPNLHVQDHLKFSEPGLQEERREWIKSAHTFSKLRYDNDSLSNQRELLTEMFDALDGDYWFDNSGWKVDSEPICQWYGVECYFDCPEEDIQNDVCPVTGLWLWFSFASGDIDIVTRIWEQLPFLINIDMSSNAIYGELPDFNLPQLEYLNIYENQITGTIHDFHGIPNIKHLEIDGNILSGTAPDFSMVPSIEKLLIGSNSRLLGTVPNFAFIPMISVLSLSGNKLEGIIPVFDSIPNIKRLSVSRNKLSGTIPDLAHIPELIELSLGDNNLYGTVPNFNNLPSVIRIYLGANPLNGTIPDFDKIPQLLVIELSDTMLQGTIPNFAHVPKLENMYLYNIGLEGTVPNFGNIPYAVEISLSDNKLTGTLPSFNSIPSISVISLSGNQLSGTIPKFGYTPNLSRLHLQSNKLSGTMHDFATSSYLRILYMYGNLLTGSIPDFQGIPNLEELSLSSNLLEGEIPNFSNLPKALVLYLDSNRLTGSIPDFRSMRNIISLDVSRNSLTGSIPPFTDTTQLITFSSYENQLSGAMPNFENCPNMRKLSIFRNLLSGSLPIIRLSKLEVLDLSENFFSGSIPSSLYVPSIQHIDFSRNNLTGVVPSTFEFFYSIKSLVLSFNRLTGSIPRSLWLPKNLVLIDLGNNLFSGDIAEFISPFSSYGAADLMRVDFSYETLILDNNMLYGAINSRIYNYIQNAKTLSIRNNNITLIDEVTNLLKWTHLDLSENPIIGHIPESYSRFTKMNFLGLKGTLMKHGVANFLPQFIKFTDPFNLEDKSESYICPSLVSNPGAVDMTIELNPNYYNHSLCQCLPNYFGFGNRCIQCPSGCECEDGLSLKRCYASPNVIDVKSILPCPRPDSCDAIIPIKNPYTKHLPYIDDLCHKGYQGRACSKCESGYGRQGRVCVECTDAVKYSTLFTCLFFLFFFIACLCHSEPSNSAKIRIIVMHAQTLSIISGFIDSETLNKFLETASSIGSIHLPNIGCLLDSTSEISALGFSFARIPVFLSVGVTFFLFGSTRMKNRAIIVTLNLMFFIYYSIARDVFGVLGCTVYDEGDNTWYLNYVPWIACDPVSGEYRKMVGVACVVLIVFLVGFPLLLWRNMRPNDRDVMQHQSQDRGSFDFMHLPYKEGFKYWEFVIIGRRIAFSFVISVVPYTYSTIFFLLLVIIIQTSIWIQKEFHPYKSGTENKMELSSLYMIFVSFFLALLSSFLGIQDWITAIIITINVTWLLCVFWFGMVIPLYKAAVANRLRKVSSPANSQDIESTICDAGESKPSKPQSSPTLQGAQTNIPEEQKAPVKAVPVESNESKKE